MPNYMCRAILHTTDNVAENFVQNQFCVATGSAEIDPDGILTAVQDFYRALTALYPSTIAQTGHELKIYELPGVQPNYPIFELAWTFSSAPSGATGPAEIALCASFQGPRVPGQPQSRRRGRIYIGPLDSTVSAGARPNTTTMETINDAAAAFHADILALTGHFWAVWSAIDEEPVAITNGWCDNAWDVQRRRGLDPSAREIWTGAG